MQHLSLRDFMGIVGTRMLAWQAARSDVNATRAQLAEKLAQMETARMALSEAVEEFNRRLRVERDAHRLAAVAATDGLEREIRVVDPIDIANITATIVGS